MKEKNSYNYFWQCFLDVLGDQSGNYKLMTLQIFVRSYRESSFGRTASKLKNSS